MPHPAAFQREVNGEQHEFLRIPIPKASTKEEPNFIEVDVTLLPAISFEECFYQGVKSLVAGRGFTDIKGDKTAKNRELAMQVAQANVDKLMEGKIRVTGGKVKTSGAVMTEALNMSRKIIKDEIKRQGKVKVSHVPASKITELAKQYLATDDGAKLVEKAKAIVAEREAVKVTGIDLSGVTADPKLVAADEKARAKKAKAKDEVGDVVASVQQRGRGQHANR